MLACDVFSFVSGFHITGWIGIIAFCSRVFSEMNNAYIVESLQLVYLEMMLALQTPLGN